MYKQISLLAAFLISTFALSAQENVGIGTTTPDPSAKLEVFSTTQGFLLPRMTCEERDDILSPADGLLVFVTDTCDDGGLPGLWYFSSIQITWKPVVNIFILNANTLDQAYDEGGPGAGRTITVDAGSVSLQGTAANASLDVDNSTNTGIEVNTTDGTGIDVTATTGTGIDVGVSGGDGIFITNTTSEGVEISTTGSGRGIFAENVTANAGNVIDANMGGTSVPANFWATGGRAGYFSISDGTTHRPALEGRTDGSTYGVLGISDAFTSLHLAEALPPAGIAGLSVTDAGRNGLSGLSKKGRGAWGRTTLDNPYGNAPSTYQSGIYGVAGDGFGGTGTGLSPYVGVVGFTSNGMASLGYNNNKGHGIVGIAKAAGAASEAGVWGVVQDGNWANHATAFPWLDDAAASNKGPVGVLGQGKEAIGMWAESQESIGLVATSGVKRSKASFGPAAHTGLIATTSKGDGRAAFIANSMPSTKPILEIGGTTTMEPAVFVITESTNANTHLFNMGMAGRGLVVQNGMPDAMFPIPGGGKEALFVQQNFDDFPAFQFRTDNPMNMDPAVVGTTIGMGNTMNLVTDNEMNGVPVLEALHKGIGSAAKFAAIKAGSPEPTVEIFSDGITSHSLLITSTSEPNSSAVARVSYAGVGHGIKVEAGNDTPDGGLTRAAIAAETNSGIAGLFENTQLTPNMAVPTVSIKSSSPGQTALTVEATAPGLGDAKAASFTGTVDISKKLTAGDGIDISSGDLDVSGGDILDVSTIGTLLSPVGIAHITTVMCGVATCAPAKPFKIDHPLDPYNKYLYHISIESDEILNMYTGNVRTDADGFATIPLADWMTHLNEDFRYQLTVMDRSFARAIVWDKMDDHGRFTIKTDEPNIEVSWLVAGTRKDAFVQEHPFTPEVMKEPDHQGTLLTRTLYNVEQPWEYRLEMPHVRRSGQWKQTAVVSQARGQVVGKD